MLDRYVKQVRLLLSVLPDMAREPVFALKGGTAINLFYRDMPRLSVDIDLTYLPVAGPPIVARGNRRCARPHHEGDYHPQPASRGAPHRGRR